MSSDTSASAPVVELDVWTDFACPFCYLAKPRLDEAIAATGRAPDIRLRYRAWELFPDVSSTPIDSWDYVVAKMGGAVEQARQLEDRVAGLAREQGQPYRVSHPVASSVLAHRVLKLAAEFDLGSAFLDRLQRDVFGGGVDVYHADYLRPVAIELGVPADRVESLLAGDEYLAEVRADEAEGREIGLTGVPFTVIDGTRAIAGMTSVDGFRRAIEAAFAEGAKS